MIVIFGTTLANDCVSGTDMAHNPHTAKRASGVSTGPEERLEESKRRNLVKKILVPFALVLTVVAFAPAAFAASPQTANLTLSATVINNCTISTTPVAFGNYDPLSGSVTQASGTVVITCTKNAATTIWLGNGNNFLVNRQMKDSGAQLMAYELYQPASNAAGAVCAYTQRWGTTGSEIFSPTAAPSKAARTYNVCGQIAAGLDLAAAVFNDSVVATVNF
jgi:spore coat protein U-like protein